MFSKTQITHKTAFLDCYFWVLEWQSVCIDKSHCGGAGYIQPVYVFYRTILWISNANITLGVAGCVMTVGPGHVTGTTRQNNIQTWQLCLQHWAQEGGTLGTQAHGEAATKERCFRVMSGASNPDGGFSLSADAFAKFCSEEWNCNCSEASAAVYVLQ